MDELRKKAVRKIKNALDSMQEDDAEESDLQKALRLSLLEASENTDIKVVEGVCGSEKSLECSFDIEVDEQEEASADDQDAVDFGLEVEEFGLAMSDWTVAVTATQNLRQLQKQKQQPTIERVKKAFTISGLDEINNNLDKLNQGMNCYLHLKSKYRLNGKDKPAENGSDQLVSDNVRRYNRCTMRSLVDHSLSFVYPEMLGVPAVPVLPVAETPIDLPQHVIISGAAKNFSFSNFEIAETIQSLVDVMCEKWRCGKPEARKKLVNLLCQVREPSIEFKDNKKPRFAAPNSDSDTEESDLKTTGNTIDDFFKTISMQGEEKQECECESDDATKIDSEASMFSGNSSQRQAMLLQNTEVLSFERPKWKVLLELPALSVIEVESFRNMNGIKYAEITCPHQGWIACQDEFGIPNMMIKGL